MRWMTRYFCIKKVWRVAGIAITALIMCFVLIWNISNDSQPTHESEWQIQSLRHKLQARRNPGNASALSFETNSTSNVINVSGKLTTGLERAQRVHEMCKKLRDRECHVGNGKSPYCNAESKVRVDYIKHRKFMFCPMCKMASTFWTRVFRMVTLNDAASSARILKTPYDVPISDAPASSYRFDTHRKVVLPGDRAVFKFMFVRDPYVMLFSTYVDKIIGPNPVYWQEFGVEATTRLRQEKSKVCGSDLTFGEFLNHVTYQYKTNRKMDCHFAKYATCNPCSVNYDFIGKMETFKEDTFDILTILNQSASLNVLKEEFGALHAADAIEDSVSGPFSWKVDIIKCISWHEALKRIWRKLQIRGILGPTRFPLSPKESDHISKEAFIAMATSMRQQSESRDRSALKEQAYVEAYKSVSADVIEGIKEVYKEEFEIFNYDGKHLIQDIAINEHPLSNLSLFDLSNV